MLRRIGLCLSLLLSILAQPDISSITAVIGGISSLGLCWYSVSSYSIKKQWLTLFVWMFIVSGCHFSWMTSTTLLGPVIYVPWLALCALSGGVFATFSIALFWAKQHRSFKNVLLVFPLLWVFWESIRHYKILSGISLDYMGWVLTSTPMFAQLASFFGWAGLSIVVISVNIAFLYWLQYRQRRFLLCYVTLLVVPLAIGGSFRAWVKHKERVTHVDVVRVALFQTSELPFISRPSNVLSVWERIFRLCGRIDSPIDLMVMPEVAVPFGEHKKIYPGDALDILKDRWMGGEKSFSKNLFFSNKEVASVLSDSFHCDLIMGIERFVEQGQRFYNSAIMFSPKNQIVGSYDKRILVPGGEYIPGGKFGEKVFKLFCPEYVLPYVREPGVSPGVFLSKNHIPLAVTICYEETFGALVREYTLSGAKLLINISNDGWYPRSRLPKVHFLHGVMRNLECGLPCVRACHTGVTAAVDALGRVIARLPDDNFSQSALPGVLVVDVPLFCYGTPYIVYGDWPLKIASWFAVIVFLLWCIPSYRKFVL